MVTLMDLGVLRSVESRPDGTVVVTITPTYSGCPALATMRDDLYAALARAGFSQVEVNTVLSPAWTTDWVTEEGRRKLREHGVAPPTVRPADFDGPIPLTLRPFRPRVACPRCGSVDTEQLSQFGSTACKALHRCHACDEPFERMKEI